MAGLPRGVFDNLRGLEILKLDRNFLEGLAPNDPLFAGLPKRVKTDLRNQR